MIHFSVTKQQAKFIYASGCILEPAEEEDDDEEEEED